MFNKKTKVKESGLEITEEIIVNKTIKWKGLLLSSDTRGFDLKDTQHYSSCNVIYQLSPKRLLELHELLSHAIISGFLAEEKEEGINKNNK